MLSHMYMQKIERNIERNELIQRSTYLMESCFPHIGTQIQVASCVDKYHFINSVEVFHRWLRIGRNSMIQHKTEKRIMHCKKSKIDQFFRPESESRPHRTAQHIANIICKLVTTPRHANINDYWRCLHSQR